MDVRFRRTGERRYGVIVALPGKPAQSMDPAPGYDDDIPHDLVHYVVEAELGLASGVYGRAQKGGGTFIAAPPSRGSARERSRAQRKQRKREQSLRDTDEARHDDMVLSERLSGLCDLAWRRRHGQRPDPAHVRATAPLSREDAPRVERVLDHLDALALLWRALPVGGELVFAWPSAEPKFDKTPIS